MSNVKLDEGLVRVDSVSGILDSAMIHFGDNRTDEISISHVAATGRVEIENTGSEPLVGLR